ncbi:MAG TPA: ABC transporter ATP-binding protein [Bryobacteraceae bacterium]
MSDIAIRVEGLSKRYRINGRQAKYRTIRESITTAARSILHPMRRANGGSLNGRSESIWALKDASFEVRHGEVVGLIGRNGAGKSTLLKLLSRITEPTGGYGEIRGRVGSLLEVGTGFHPELTGRENTFFNGAVLGMRRSDIARKFDAIVAFAEVEKFIDTPVKHYSTGMYLRLAFAVAAHLEPEILLVDEILAVGDLAFQRKCLGKMGDVAREGRTVLFVSHNMAAVRALCSRGILLDRGRVEFAGPTELAIYNYQKSLSSKRTETSGVQVDFTDIQVNGQGYASIACGSEFDVSFTLHLNEGYPGFYLWCLIQDGNGEYIVIAPTSNKELGIPSDPGRYPISLHFPALWLRPGVYGLHFKLLGSTANSGNARFLSENVMLDVDGSDGSEATKAYLTPQVTWTVNDRAEITI